MASLAFLGCVPRPGVLRLEDGAYVVGAAYEPSAYAYALAGALAENDGHYADAARAYERALDAAAGDPELQTRLYHASCFAAPAGAFDEKKARQDGLEQAMQRGYSPAYAALADCVTRQGSHGDPAALASAHEGLARTSRDPAELARLAGAPSANQAAVREDQLELRLSVLITAHPEAREPYLALGECLERAGKRLAAAQAYAEYARLQPSDRRKMLVKAEALAARGEGYGARWLAAAALDAPALAGAPLGALPALGVRLAIDEALLRGDERASLRRASRGRVALGEVAARALLAGDRAFGERLARSVIDAGDGNADAAAVLLDLGAGAPDHVIGTPTESGRRVLERAAARAGASTH